MDKVEKIYVKISIISAIVFMCCCSYWIISDANIKKEIAHDYDANNVNVVRFSQDEETN